MQKSLLESSYFVQKNGLIKPSTNIICGLSGGQDSILLFCILLHLKKIWNLKIFCVYCHHFLQPQNFYTVHEIWKLTSLFQIPVSFFFPEEHFKNELAARTWRHNKLCRIAEFFDSQTVVIGHTASDVIETALWHIVRGTSPKGLISLQPRRALKIYHFSRIPSYLFLTKYQQKTLYLLKSENNFNLQKDKYSCIYELKKPSINKTFTGVLWNRPLTQGFIQLQDRKNIKQHSLIKIVSQYNKNIDRNINSKVTFFSKTNKVLPCVIIRPLYDFHRCDISSVIQENFLPYVTDPTNVNMAFTRNRIRSEILPLFRYFINSRSDFHLYTYLQITRIQQHFLQNILRTILESYCNIPKTIDSFLQLPETLQSECIYQLTKSYSSRQVYMLQINYIRSFIN